MFRKHWREPAFWRWLWRNRIPLGAKLALAVASVVLFLGGGFFAADRLASANAGVSATDAFTFETTIQKLVTVREHGKTVVKRVPVVRRVFLRPQTAFETRYDTRLITTPGGIRTVRQKFVRYVPVVKRRTITVDGKTRTLTETRLVPTTTERILTQTQTSVVTNQQTVVNQNTVTVVKNQTDTELVTVTETHTETAVETQTLPGDTVIETVTETSPPVTVTETVTSPGP
jgi:hypothetical protein